MGEASHRVSETMVRPLQLALSDMGAMQEAEEKTDAS